MALWSQHNISDKMCYLPLLGGCYVYCVTIKVLLAVRGDNLLSDSDYILLEKDYILLESDYILLESKNI